MMGKQKTKFYCQDCGYESIKWLGKCPDCGAWNTFVEEIQKIMKTQGMDSSLFQTKEKPQPIINIESSPEPRVITENRELNRVLGEGSFPGPLY